jgi:hypothetical protein
MLLLLKWGHTFPNMLMSFITLQESSFKLISGVQFLISKASQTASLLPVNYKTILYGGG